MGPREKTKVSDELKQIYAQASTPEISSKLARSKSRYFSVQSRDELRGTGHGVSAF
jgi:hypothetical protein